MFASRDQENLVHAHQTNAAGKPLSQSLKGLQSKTPGNRAPKTPFRVALNDENKPIGLNGQKSILRGFGRGDENILRTTKRDGKLDKNAFVTPSGRCGTNVCTTSKLTTFSGPRTRAPLEVKTTNAKGQVFQTPGLVQPTTKADKSKKPSTTRRSIKSKITIAPSEPVEADLLAFEDDDVPDIEYAPLPPTELPDPPEVFEYDQDFPQFKGANMCRGFGEIYFAEPKDEHGVSLSLREYEEKCAQYDKEVERQIEESLNNLSDPGAELDHQVDAMIVAGPKIKAGTDSGIDTVKARRAADALSQSRVPSVAMKPTSSSLQKSRRKPTFSVLNSRETPGPTNPSPMRHKAAQALSKNTIGFPRARHASSILPQRPKQLAKDTNFMASSPVKQSNVHPVHFRELYGDPPEGSDMWIRLRQHDLFMEEVGEYDAADHLFNTNFSPPDDDDGEIFQLPMPS